MTNVEGIEALENNSFDLFIYLFICISLFNITEG